MLLSATDGSLGVIHRPRELNGQQESIEVVKPTFRYRGKVESEKESEAVTGAELHTYIVDGAIKIRCFSKETWEAEQRKWAVLSERWGHYRTIVRVVVKVAAVAVCAFLLMRNSRWVVASVATLALGGLVDIKIGNRHQDFESKAKETVIFLPEIVAAMRKITGAVIDANKEDVFSLQNTFLAHSETQGAATSAGTAAVEDVNTEMVKLCNEIFEYCLIGTAFAYDEVRQIWSLADKEFNQLYVDTEGELTFAQIQAFFENNPRAEGRYEYVHELHELMDEKMLHYRELEKLFSDRTHSLERYREQIRKTAQDLIEDYHRSMCSFLEETAGDLRDEAGLKLQHSQQDSTSSYEASRAKINAMKEALASVLLTRQEQVENIINEHCKALLLEETECEKTYARHFGPAVKEMAKIVRKSPGANLDSASLPFGGSSILSSFEATLAQLPALSQTLTYEQLIEKDPKLKKEHYDAFMARYREAFERPL